MLLDRRWLKCDLPLDWVARRITLGSIDNPDRYVLTRFQRVADIPNKRLHPRAVDTTLRDVANSKAEGSERTVRANAHDTEPLYRRHTRIVDDNVTG